MTRFKELRRIERAIEDRDQAELRWAAEYCQDRLRVTRTKDGASRWRKIEKCVRATLNHT
jgi:hypothetical protein